MPIVKRLFRISPSEVSFATRGFPDDGTGVREHLEHVGAAFVDGYNAALGHSTIEALTASLNALPCDLHGFAHEGASMALGIFDLLMPWKRTRTQALIERAPQHVYLCLVGMGWSLARLRIHRIPEFVRRAHPILAPLAADGFGFHQAFFKPKKIVRTGAAAPLPAQYARAFDQGVGRSLWFVDGGNPARIARTIAGFTPARHADLWSGCGLALAYAGGVDETAAAELLERSGMHRPSAAQGIAFAAKARHLAGNITPTTELACALAWNRTVCETAALVDEAYVDSEKVADDVRYGTWQKTVTSYHH